LLQRASNQKTFVIRLPADHERLLLFGPQSAGIITPSHKRKQELMSLRIATLLVIAPFIVAASPATTPTDPAPSLVSLHLKDQPTSVALNSIAAQAHIQFSHLLPRANEPFPDPTITIDCDNLPLLEAMAQISRDVGISPIYCSGGRITLIAGEGAWGRRPSRIQGAFRVSATSAQTQRLILASSNPRELDSTTLNLTVTADPNINALFSEPFVPESIVDQEERPIPLKTARPIPGYFSRGNLQLNLEIDPPTQSTHIRLLTGNLNVFFASKTHHVQVPRVMDVGEVKKDFGPLNVSVIAQRDPTNYTIRVHIDYEGDDPIFWKQCTRALGSTSSLAVQAYYNGAGGFYRIWDDETARTTLLQYELDWHFAGGLVTFNHASRRWSLTAGTHFNAFTSDHGQRETGAALRNYTNHGHKNEANAFAKVAVAASPAVAALIAYCEAEAAALIRANIEIVQALVEALIERGILTGDEIDAIIAREIAVKALANERARRAAWKIVEKNAADFTALRI